MGIGGNLLRSAVAATKAVVDAINSVVGTNADTSSDNTISGKLAEIFEHMHSSSQIYPKLADPVLITKAGGAWAAYGTPTEVVPVDTITVEFDLHWVVVSDISANGFYTATIYKGLAGSEIAIAEIAANRNAVQSQEGSIPIATAPIPANTRISVALSSSNAGADTVNVRLMYHLH